MKYILACLAFFLSLSFNTNAQTKPTVIKKANLPKLTTTLGAYKDSVSLTPAQVASVIGQPLKIVSDKNVEYKVSSYQFIYRRVDVSETEDGKPIPATSVKSKLFVATPLEPIWVKTIQEDVHKGEKLIFMEVVVKDAQGKVFSAPSLTITVL